jgi:hypothetical protein
MKSVIANRWWGMEDGKNKIHWRSWEWLSMPKCLGGMGFCELALFNQAMLPKTAWHLLTIPDSLCARVLKGRYYPDTDLGMQVNQDRLRILGVACCMVETFSIRAFGGVLAMAEQSRSRATIGYVISHQIG